MENMIVRADFLLTTILEVHINTGSAFSIESVTANSTHQSKPSSEGNYYLGVHSTTQKREAHQGWKRLQLDPDQELFHSKAERKGWRKPYTVNPVVDKNGYFSLNNYF